MSIKHALTSGKTAYYLARHVWHVGREVIIHAATLVDRLGDWVAQQYRELTNGAEACRLERMVRFCTVSMGLLELTHRWYRHRYPTRFIGKSG